MDGLLNVGTEDITRGMQEHARWSHPDGPSRASRGRCPRAKRCRARESSSRCRCRGRAPADTQFVKVEGCQHEEALHVAGEGGLAHATDGSAGERAVAAHLARRARLLADGDGDDPEADGGARADGGAAGVTRAGGVAAVKA
eukprot:6180133-Pleurochrysis_carterae.AAC.1